MSLTRTWLPLAALVAIAGPAAGQEPGPAADPSPAELEPAVDTSAATAEDVPAEPAAPSGPPVGRARDRIELDATQITGNRELPKVLYIVPWKRSDLGDLVGKPVNSLLDEVLAPVDRDVFRRENRYYRALQPDDPDAAGSRPRLDAPGGD